MVAGIGLGRLARVIHPYPTRAEVIRKAPDAYNRARLTRPSSTCSRAGFAGDADGHGVPSARGATDAAPVGDALG